VKVRGVSFRLGDAEFGNGLEEGFGNGLEEVFGNDVDEGFGNDLDEGFGNDFDGGFGNDLDDDEFIISLGEVEFGTELDKGVGGEIIDEGGGLGRLFLRKNLIGVNGDVVPLP